MSAEQWFYVRDKTRERVGPVSADEIRNLIQAGELHDADYVWKQGMPNWAPLGTLKHVFSQGERRPSAFAGSTGEFDMDLSGLNLDAGAADSSLEGLRVDFDLGESFADRHPYVKGGAAMGAGAAAGRGRGGMSVSDHAGFGRRLIAFIIDGVLLTTITILIMLIMVGPVFVQAGIEMFRVVDTMQENGTMPRGPAAQSEFDAEFERRTAHIDEQAKERVAPIMRIIEWIGLAIAVLYGTVMEWSPLQGTLGKLALGLAVTGKDGDRAALGRVFARNLFKRLPLLIPCMGYPLLFVMTLVCVFTPEKQAVQDLVSGCLVERK